MADANDSKPSRVNKVTMKDGGTYKYGVTASNIQGGLETLDMKRSTLEASVKASQAGRKEYEEEIFRLQERRKFLQARYNKNKAWVDVYDQDIGPFEKTYVNLVEEIHRLYEAAKGKHVAAIDLLIKEFNYHPLFKHWDDEFTGVPFKPL